jgi:hypothetical protein
MTTFFQHTCHKCGLIDEARFVFAGPHIKQVCNGCGFYVKFFDKGMIPDVKDIKYKTWYISNLNIDLINSAKKQVEFMDVKGSLNQKMMYWKLYLKVREMIKKGVTP